MPNIFHQSIEDIIKTASPEQKILWNYIFLRFGERLSVSQFVYEGLAAGNECLTYTAGKLYFAYQLTLAPLTAGINLIPAAHLLYDENNVLKFSLNSNTAMYDTTAAAVRYNLMARQFVNLVFSRIDVNGAGRFSVVGYRIMY